MFDVGWKREILQTSSSVATPPKTNSNKSCFLGLARTTQGPRKKSAGAFTHQPTKPTKPNPSSPTGQSFGDPHRHDHQVLKASNDHGDLFPLPKEAEAEKKKPFLQAGLCCL